MIDRQGRWLAAAALGVLLALTPAAARTVPHALPEGHAACMPSCLAPAATGTRDDRAGEHAGAPPWPRLAFNANRPLPMLKRPPRPPAARPPRTRTPPSRLRKPPRRNATVRLSPSEALQLAMQAMPGSMGLGVELLPGARPVYAVKLKAGNRVMRVLVDAVTGRIIGR